MKKIIIYFTLPLLLLSCSLRKGVSFSEVSQGFIPFNEMLRYELVHPMGFQNIYMVDTIRLNNPVVFRTENGPLLIMEREAFDSFTGKKEELLERDDTFLYASFLLPNLPMWFFQRYNIGNDCPLEQSSEKRENISSRIFYFKEQPVFFQMYLVNGVFYRDSFVGIDGDSGFSDRRAWFNYYRLLIPVCE